MQFWNIGKKFFLQLWFRYGIAYFTKGFEKKSIYLLPPYLWILLCVKEAYDLSNF